MTIFEIPEALAEDPEILSAAKSLILDSIAHAQELLDEGIPSVKMGIIRSLLPAAVKLATHQKTLDDEVEELRAQVNDMYARMFSVIEEEAGAEADHPPTG